MTVNTPRVLRLPEVKDRTGLSKSTIATYEADGKFPRRVQLSDRNVGWHESEISDWINTRTSRAKHCEKVAGQSADQGVQRQAD